MSVTEVGCMGVKPGLNVMDETTPEGQVLSRIWKSVVTAPGGPNRVYWGLEIENPANVWAFFDWDSLDHHENFAKTLGKEAVKDLPTVLSHSDFSKHITASPLPLSSLQAPVTELFFVYFAADISPAEKDTVDSLINEFIEKALVGYPEVRGINTAWGVENDFPVRGGNEGQTGSVLALFLGWTSVAAHKQFAQSDVFKDNINLVKGLPGVVGTSMTHVSCVSHGRKTE